MRSRLTTILPAALGAVALFALSPGAASACSCMKPEKGPSEQLEEGAIVALGVPELVSGNPAGPGIRYAPVRYSFWVRKALGADLPETIEVETADNSAACGVDLRGRESAMLLLLPGEGGVYNVNLCSQLNIDAFEEEWRALLDAAPDR